MAPEDTYVKPGCTEFKIGWTMRRESDPMFPKTVVVYSERGQVYEQFTRMVRHGVRRVFGERFEIGMGFPGTTRTLRKFLTVTVTLRMTVTVSTYS